MPSNQHPRWLRLIHRTLKWDLSPPSENSSRV
jgi:hypothetical protein